MYFSGNLGKNQHLGILKTFEITLALLGVISKVFKIPRVDFSQITLKNMRLLLLIKPTCVPIKKNFDKAD